MNVGPKPVFVADPIQQQEGFVTFKGLPGNADGAGPVNLNDQFSELQAAGLAVNAGTMIGFNSVWREVVGLDEIRPTQSQIQAMQLLIRQGLEAGAWGVSAGLDYVPGYYATNEEVVEVLAPFSEWNVVFANHDRVTPQSGFSSIAGMSETIDIGEAAGLIPLITHMKVQGWEQGNASTILGLMREADTNFTGGAVADVYPYLAGQTGLQSLIIPSWAQAGGRDTIFRLSPPESGRYPRYPNLQYLWPPHVGQRWSGREQLRGTGIAW